MLLNLGGPCTILIYVYVEEIAFVAVVRFRVIINSRNTCPSFPLSLVSFPRFVHVIDDFYS